MEGLASLGHGRSWHEEVCRSELVRVCIKLFTEKRGVKCYQCNLKQSWDPKEIELVSVNFMYKREAVDARMQSKALDGTSFDWVRLSFVLSFLFRDEKSKMEQMKVNAPIIFR